MAFVVLEALTFVLVILTGSVDGQLQEGTTVCSQLSQETICKCLERSDGEIRVDCGQTNFDEIPTEIPPNTVVL